MEKNLFITGKPGAGKTTLIREVCLPYAGRIGGFYTEEIRENGSRQGFLLKTFDGKSGVLARKGLVSPCRVTKYGIDLAVLEGIGTAALVEALASKDIVVIDEIGSMEILSAAFHRQLTACLTAKKRVLATIRQNAQPFTDSVKRMADTCLLSLTRDNYIDIKKQVKAWMEVTNDC